MTDKERLHRIWVTAEYLFIWWQYLSDEERSLHLLRILEDSRNSEQVRQLKEKLGETDEGELAIPRGIE